MGFFDFANIAPAHKVRATPKAALNLKTTYPASSLVGAGLGLFRASARFVRVLESQPEPAAF